MNQVFNINLGGYPFTIDHDAYQHLKDYLGAIEAHFSKMEGFEDITTDIEVRMAELFRERLQSRQIVSLKDVQAAIHVMGTPEDFGAESSYSSTASAEEEPVAQGAGRGAASDFRSKLGRRLYRNGEDRKVGGVAAGVSAYFGIEDPIWVRLGFVLTVFVGGFGVPLYLIMWAILPEAKTAKQKLEMRGEKIDVNSIAKTIEEEVEYIKERITELGDEFKAGAQRTKKKTVNDDAAADHWPAAHGSRLGDTAAHWALRLERLMRGLLRPIGYAIGGLLMLIVLVLWVALIAVVVTSFSVTHFMAEGALAPLFLGSLVLVVGVPLLGVAMSVIRLFFGGRIKRVWSILFIVLFGVGVAGVTGTASRVAPDFKVEEMDIETLSFTPVADDPVSFTSSTFDRSGLGWVSLDELHLGPDALHYHPVHLRIERADSSDRLAVTVARSARGRDEATAKARAATVPYEIKQTMIGLRLPDFVALTEGQWRDQRVHLTIHIPEGQSFTFDPAFSERIYLELETADGLARGRDLLGESLQMMANGVIVL